MTQTTAEQQQQGSSKKWEESSGSLLLLLPSLLLPPLSVSFYWCGGLCKGGKRACHFRHNGMIVWRAEQTQEFGQSERERKGKPMWADLSPENI
jgi:hypothetical protein